MASFRLPTNGAAYAASMTADLRMRNTVDYPPAPNPGVDYHSPATREDMSCFVSLTERTLGRALLLQRTARPPIAGAARPLRGSASLTPDSVGPVADNPVEAEAPRVGE